LMEGSKRRKRKSDRIDAHKLARLGRVDPQSLYLRFGIAVEKCARIWWCCEPGTPWYRYGRS
jgi:hypothetical protein